MSSIVLKWRVSENGVSDLVMCIFQLLVHLPRSWHKEHMPLYNIIIVYYFNHTTLYWSIYVLYVLPACRIILITILLVLTALPCGTPSSLSNGQRHYSSTTVGSTVTYTCDPGYMMTAGNVSRTCLFGGRWSGNHPTCSSEFTLVTFIYVFCLVKLRTKELTHHMHPVS